jgi:hypothetical protein
MPNVAPSTQTNGFDHSAVNPQLRAHLTDFLNAYNFARRLKTLKGLAPYEYLCKLWTQTPDRFTLNPIHQMPGLNTWVHALIPPNCWYGPVGTVV